MIVALDVQYDDAQAQATAAAVMFEGWTDPAPATELTVVVDNIQPYVPGEFFHRELPCLVAVISKIQEAPDLFVVDGYVRLGDRPGLGQHLFDHFEGRVPVVGVAKTRFHGAAGVEVLRGGSKSALHVTAIGCDLAEAAEHIREMHGPHRIPTLLKRVDQLAKGR